MVVPRLRNSNEWFGDVGATQLTTAADEHYIAIFISLRMAMRQTGIAWSTPDRPPAAA